MQRGALKRYEPRHGHIQQQLPVGRLSLSLSLENLPTRACIIMTGAQLLTGVDEKKKTKNRAWQIGRSDTFCRLGIVAIYIARARDTLARVCTKHARGIRKMCVYGNIWRFNYSSESTKRVAYCRTMGLGQCRGAAGYDRGAVLSSCFFFRERESGDCLGFLGALEVVRA